MGGERRFRVNAGARLLVDMDKAIAIRIFKGKIVSSDG